MRKKTKIRLLSGLFVAAEVEGTKFCGDQTLFIHDMSKYAQLKKDAPKYKFVLDRVDHVYFYTPAMKMFNEKEVLSETRFLIARRGMNVTIEVSTQREWFYNSKQMHDLRKLWGDKFMLMININMKLDKRESIAIKLTDPDFGVYANSHLDVISEEGISTAYIEDYGKDIPLEKFLANQGYAIHAQQKIHADIPRN